MKFTYNKEELETWLIANREKLLADSTFKALIVEMKVAEDAGNVFTNSTGHDEVSSKGVRIETKYTDSKQQGNNLRIGNAGESKRAGFDFLRIIDGYNQRIFEIPHDEYFSRANRHSSEFRWSSSYNETDKVQIGNTNLLLEYEITTA